MEKSYNILLDSNSYFRLANQLHPLLNNPFGKFNYRLYVHEDLETEYARNARLKVKFNWVNEQKYIDNRRAPLNLSRVQKKEADDTYNHLEGVKEDKDLGTQYYDLKCLAKAITLRIPIVTDDADLLILANIFNASKMSTIKLLSFMVAPKFINEEKVVSIFKEWILIKDFPKNRKNDLNKLFRLDYELLKQEMFSENELGN